MSDLLLWAMGEKSCLCSLLSFPWAVTYRNALLSTCCREEGSPGVAVRPMSCHMRPTAIPAYLTTSHSCFYPDREWPPIHFWSIFPLPSWSLSGQNALLKFICSCLCPRFFLKILFYLFLERGEGRDKDRERSIDVREKHQWVASTGDWICNPGRCPHQWHFALQRENQTCDPLVRRPALNPLSHTSQDDSHLL